MIDPIAAAKELGRMVQSYNDIPLKTKIVELTDELIRLQEENRELKARLEMKQAMAARGDHNYFYKGDEGPYCPTCWQNGKAEVLLPAPTENHLGVLRSCRVCKEHYYESKKRTRTQVTPRGGPWS